MITLLVVGCSASLDVPSPVEPAPSSTTSSPSAAPAPTTTITTPPATTVTVTTTPSPSSAPVITQIDYVNALKSDGTLHQKYTFDNSLLATVHPECREASYAAKESGIYMCTPYSNNLPACWKDPHPPTGTHHLICLRNATDTNAIVIEPSVVAPSVAAPSNPVPLNAELADGSLWRLILSSGARDVTVPGYMVTYSCITGCSPYSAHGRAIVSNTANNFTVTGNTWFATVAETGPGTLAPPIQVPVKRVWFATVYPI